MQRIFLTLLAISLLSCSLFNTAEAGSTIFTLTPTTRAPNEILQGKTAIAIYRVTNNAPVTLSGNGVVNLPSTVRQITGSGLCGSTFSLSNDSSCNLKLEISGAVSGGPEVCYSKSKPVYCSQPTPNDQLNVKVINNPTNLPLSSPSSVDLIPGTTTNITVTNDSSSTKANNITLSVPSNVENEFSSITSTGCESLAPGSNACTFHLATKSTASTSKFPATATIQGSNTKATTTSLRLVSGSVSAADVLFSTPGQQSLVLTNNSNITATINQVQFTSGNLQNVTIGDIPSACQSLAAGASCNVPLTATASSQGSGVATVSYSLSSDNRDTTANVNVANASVSINSNNEVRLEPTQADQTVTISNTGNFTLTNLSADLASSLTNTTITSNLCSGTLAVGASCEISFTTTGATVGQSTTLDATGDNIATTRQDVTIDGGLTIEPDVEAGNTHLFYRAVKVENLTPDNAQITNVAISNLDNQVAFCANGDTSCDFTSTCQLDTNIASGNSCLLWFKGEIPSVNPTLTTDTGTITVTGTTDTGNTSTTLDAAYELDLYVAGFYTTADGGTVTATNIAYFDGTDWNAITVGANNGVNAPSEFITSYRGDLYVGGPTEAGGIAVNRITYWNGNTWNNLGDGVNNTVSAMTVLDGTLYVGGSFTEAGGSSANRIAAWNGSTWSTLGSGMNSTVEALTSIGSTLYAGGNFTTAGGNSANRVASWNGTTWSALGIGMDNTVQVLTPIGTTLYAAGTFLNAGGNAANRIASWNGTTWSTLGTGMNNSVSALHAVDTTLYAGGNFTDSGGVTTNRIAAWDGNNWSTVGSGFNLGVNDLTSLGTTTLYAVGGLTNSGGTVISRVAVFDGASWQPVTTSGGSGGVGGSATSVVIVPALNITAQ